MENLAIITNGDKLTKYIGESKVLYLQVGIRLHISAVSAIWFACKHGNPGPLNQLFGFLSSNDQAALRFFIRRSHVIVGLKGGAPEGLSPEAINSAEEAGKVFGFKDKQFTVIRGHTSDQAKFLLTLCETRFIKPDGKTDKYVFERNNFEEVRTLGDEAVLKAIIRAAKLEDSDRRKHQVSPKVRKFLDSMREQAEAFMTSATLQTKAIKEDASAKAPAQTKARTPKAKTTTKAKAPAAALETATAH